MVSLQEPGSPNSNSNLSQKRKFQEMGVEETFNNNKRSSKADNTKSIVFDIIELHHETPLIPSEWERCLDVRSGEIHFYNTSKKTTSRDSRGGPEPTKTQGGHMSLELELNLPCDSQRKNQASNNVMMKQNSASPPHLDLGDDLMKKKKSGDLTSQYPSWLAFEGEDQQQQEMVATACMRCHMLVMLCKSSPTCPNCKFLHPPDQSPPKFFKQKLSLLC